MTDAGFDFFHNLKQFIATGNVLQSRSKQERWKVQRSAKNFIIKGNVSTIIKKIYIVHYNRLHMWHTDSLFFQRVRLFYFGPKRQYMRLVIENDKERDKVLRECHHNAGTGNHNGVRGTQNKVLAGYFWFTQAEDVANMVSTLLKRR